MRENLPASDRDSNGVRSVFRTVDILKCLNNNINGLTEIAKNCNLSVSTVHRLLKTLEKTNLVTQDSNTHGYYLGPLIARLSANPQTTHQKLIICSMEEMNRLSEISGETVGLAILAGTKLIRLYDIPSKNILRVWEEGTGLGQPFVGGPAKVLLSQLKDSQLKIFLDNIELKPLTDRTVTDKEIVMKEIKEIRQRGYAVSYGERVPGALGLSAPIKNYIYPAVLTIKAPESRAHPKVNWLTEILLASAGRITTNYENISQ